VYNVLIVDDEVILRNGLIVKIDWHALGFEITMEASNGVDALLKLDQTRIHLIITDIRMDIMDGLELLEKASSCYPNLKIIVLSGYDDFQYAKTALRCGAFDYLLKPVVRSELIAVLQKIKIQLDVEQQHLLTSERMNKQIENSNRVMQEQQILELVNSEPLSQNVLEKKLVELQLDFIFSGAHKLQFIAVEMRVPTGRLENASIRENLLKSAFELLCREIAENYKMKMLPFYDPHRPSMMHFVVKINSDESAEFIEKLSQELQQNINHYLRVESVVCLGKLVDVVNFKSGYDSCLLAWSRSRRGAFSQVIHVNQQATVDELPTEMELKLKLALEEANVSRFNAQLEIIFASASNSSIHSFSFIVLKIILLIESTIRKYHIDNLETLEMLWESQKTIWESDTKEKTKNNIQLLVKKMIESMNVATTSGSGIVEAVRRFIEENYSSEINLTALSDRYHINPAYLSDLFKKITGTNFIDYIIELRMKHVLKLLKDPTLRLNDIAELTGFSNASYLSSAFKKHYGVSPNEFRNRENK
jgi:two-component system response regulator YesN